MTTRSLFSIIIKVFGLSFIRDIVLLIPNLYNILYYLSNDNIAEGISTSIITVLMLAIYIAVAYCLIFKTESIVDKLSLDAGGHLDTITFNVHRSTILTIAIMILGGYMIINEIPNLCRLLFFRFTNSYAPEHFNNSDLSVIVLSIAKIVIGLLLLGNHRPLVNYIEKRRKS